MNNARIIYDNVLEDPEVDFSDLEKRKNEMATIVEALKRVAASEDWKLLKRLVLDGVTKTLESQLSSEALKSEVNTTDLYRLQGQLAWARRYADLEKLAEFFKQQVEGIKSYINEQKNSGDGAPTSS